MTFGYELRDGNGRVYADSYTKGGVFVEILELPHNESSSKVYPNVVGTGSLYFFVLKAGRHGLIATTNAQGQGVLEWLAAAESGGNTIVAVFAKDVMAPQGDYGVVVYGEDGAVAITGTNSIPQFVGTVQPGATPVESMSIPNGQQRHTHRVSVGAVANSGTLVFVLCAIPDSGSSNLWYAWTPWLYGAGSDLDVYVFADPGASYAVPTLHLYAINQPPDPGDLYGIETLDAAGTRVFVASTKNMAVQEEFKFNFPDQNSTATYTVTMPANAGIFLPEYRFEGFVTGSYVQWYQGVVKRVGNQLTFNMLQYAEQVVVAGEPVLRRVAGNKNGNHGIIVDLLHYGAGSTPGGPPGTVLAPPVFTDHPDNVSVQVGGAYSFSVSATGNPAPTFQWYKGATPISGATGTTYNGTAASGDDGAVFKCYASNTQGSAYSNPATLTIAAPSFTAVSITSSPSNGSAQAGSGQTVTFYVAAAGTAPISYQWYDAGVSGTTYTAISGATGTSYSPSIVTGNNGKRYFCRASNSDGTTTFTADSAMATLTVTAANVDAYFTQHPGNYTRAYGDTATFTVAAGGTGPFTYRWYSSTAGFLAGETGTSLTRAAGPGDIGYRCYVTGVTGVETASNYGYLYVGQPPSISAHPSPQTVERNDTAAFSVSATNYHTVEWYRDDIEDSPGVFVGYGATHYADTSVVGIWFYHAIVIGDYGFVESNDAMLRVTAPAQYPVITQQPQSQTTTVGVQVYFSVEANYVTGYQWYRNGVSFGGNSSTCAPLVNSTSETGVPYFCRVYNGDVYTDSSDVTVTVNSAPAKPVISTQPTGGNVAVGANKLLRCVASPVTAYKWYKDGVQVSSGQDYYPDTSVDGSSNYYYCICENTVNGVTETQQSQTVLVTVGNLN